MACLGSLEVILSPINIRTRLDKVYAEYGCMDEYRKRIGLGCLVREKPFVPPDYSYLFEKPFPGFKEKLNAEKG